MMAKQPVSIADLTASVAPFAFAWPAHWDLTQIGVSYVDSHDQADNEKQIHTCSYSAALRPVLRMPPTRDVEDVCGPQAHFFLSDYMHSLRAKCLMHAVQRARLMSVELLAEAYRCQLRVINLPGERGRLRREHIQANCFNQLLAAYPFLDVGFTNGVVARDLHWKPVQGSHRHRVQKTEVNGQEYVADEQMWHAPTQNEADQMHRSFHQAGWTSGLWRAFLQDCSEPNSWGYVGCQIAHVEAWRAAYSSGVEWLMMCEDDICPMPLFGMNWVEIWGIVAGEVRALQEQGESWDLLFVGKGSSVSPEGRQITPLIVECGYNIKMHCYCVSRRGLAKLLSSELPYRCIRPQDEVLASLNVQGKHPRKQINEKITELFPAVDSFRSLCFPWWGIVFQMQHFEQHRDSELCRSAIGELGQEGNPGVS